jgi:probable HAF family extracellular repeat protein
MIHRIQSRILFPGLASAALVCGALPSCGEADCLETKTCTKTQPSSGGSGSFGGRGLGLAPAPSKGGAATAGAAPTGSGGEAGGDSGDACSDEGERRCAAAADPTILECSGGVWVVAETCARGELCDSTEVDCATIAPGCERLAPGRAFCEDNEVVVCGPDLVTVERKACEGRCASGACVDDGSGGAPSGSGGSSNPNGGSNETGGIAGSAPTDSGAGSGNEAGAPSSNPCSPNPCANDDICSVNGDSYACNPPAFEWMEPLSGWASCSAIDVSDDGHVVVGHCSDALTVQRAFRWTREDGMVALGDLGDENRAIAVSGDGAVIVGNYMIGDRRHWFRWTAATGMQGQTGLDGEVSSRVYDVNEEGSVVVGQSLNEDESEEQAFRWTTSSGGANLGKLEEGDFSIYPRAVSGAGTTIVGDSNAAAFRWTAGMGMVALPEPPNFTVSFAKAMTRDGSVVAGYGSSADGADYGLLWRDGGVEVLGDLGQAIAGVSNTGVVVAGEFVWTDKRQTADAALQEAGIELPSDATGIRVYGITPDSKTWVGFSVGAPRAFIARLPE